jgi:hypothetical protein
MKNALNLDYSTSASYSVFPSKELEAHGKALLEIDDFKKQLEYYNTHVCSLANSQTAIHLYKYGNYDHWHGHGNVWFKADPRQQTPELEVFLYERQNELDRLKKRIAREKTYAGKLKAFIEDKAGQIRVDELNAAKNDYLLFSAKGGGIVPNNLLDSYYEIDLSPVTAEQRKAYNEYLYNHVQVIRKNPDHFHRLILRKYEGFISKEAFATLTRQLQNALDPEQTIRYELRRIETKFQLGTMDDYIKTLYLSATHYCRMPQVWQSCIFNAMVNGLEIDMGNIECDLDDMMQLSHIEDVIDYYQKVLSLKRKPLLNTNSQTTPTKTAIGTGNGFQFIRPELHDMIKEVENKMKEKVEKWKTGSAKIECAGFVELLFERRYFEPTKSKVKTMVSFALSRYGSDIEIQLKPAKRVERRTHKQRLLKYFK